MTRCPKCWHTDECAGPEAEPNVEWFAEHYKVRPKYVHLHWRSNEGEIRRSYAKAVKSALKKNYKSPEDRMKYDRWYREHQAVHGRVPALKALALAIMAGNVPGARGAQLAVWGENPATLLFALPSGLAQPSVALVVSALALLCACCFATGCLAGACPLWVTRGLGRRLRRAVLAFLWEPTPIGPGHRSLGVQSQCTYTHWLADSRFKADVNGFRRAGEVGPEVFH
jgi:hypothetical protein